jgi:hypothetical protein
MLKYKQKKAPPGGQPLQVKILFQTITAHAGKLGAVIFHFYDNHPNQ